MNDGSTDLKKVNDIKPF